MATSTDQNLDNGDKITVTENDDGSTTTSSTNGNSITVGATIGGSFRNLKYPLNLFSKTQSVSPAYVKFNILEAVPSEELQGAIKSAGEGLYGTSKALTNLDFSGAADVGKNTLSALKDHIVKFVGSRLTTKETGITVALYMPPAIQVNDSMAYDTVDTKGAAEVFSEFAKGGTVEQFVEGGAANIVTNHLLSKYARSGGLFSGVAGNALIAGGRIANPATKLLFRSPSLRQLQLDFKMTPTSQAEALEITRIISVFRQAAYPALDGKAFNALYMIPNLFDIKFAFKNKDGNANPYMIQFKKCYLTQVTTTYNGSGVPAFFKDGSPIETNLTLTFQETETNSSLDIHGSGNSVTVDGKKQESSY